MTRLGINHFPNCCTRTAGQQAHWGPCWDVATDLGAERVRSTTELRDGNSLCTTGLTSAIANADPTGLETWVEGCHSRGLRMLITLTPDAPLWWGEDEYFITYDTNPFRPTQSGGALIPAGLTASIAEHLQFVIDSVRAKLLDLGVSDPTEWVQYQAGNEYAKGGAQGSTWASAVTDGGGSQQVTVATFGAVDDYPVQVGEYVTISGHATATYNRTYRVTGIGENTLALAEYIPATGSGWGSATITHARGNWDVAALTLYQAVFPALDMRGHTLWGPALGPNQSGDDSSMDITLETMVLPYMSEAGVYDPTTWWDAMDGYSYHQYIASWGVPLGSQGWSTHNVERARFWTGRIRTALGTDLPIVMSEFGCSLEQLTFSGSSANRYPQYEEEALGEYLGTALKALCRSGLVERVYLYAAMDYRDGAEALPQDRFGMLRLDTAVPDRWNGRYRQIRGLVGGTWSATPPTGTTWQGSPGGGLSY